MKNKIQKILDLTCQECLSVYQLLEIHQNKQKHESDHCLTHWQKLLHQHYQEQIILHLAQEEAKKDQNDYEDKN